MLPAAEHPGLSQPALLWDLELLPAVGAGLELSYLPVRVTGAVTSGRADAHMARYAQRLDGVPVFWCIRWVTKMVVVEWALVRMVVYTLVRWRHNPTPDSISHGVHRMLRGPILRWDAESTPHGVRKLCSVFRCLRYAAQCCPLFWCLRSATQCRRDIGPVFGGLRFAHTATYYWTGSVQHAV